MNIAKNKKVFEYCNSPQFLTIPNLDTFTTTDGTSGYCGTHWPAYLTIDLQDNYDIAYIRFFLWKHRSNPNNKYRYRLLLSADRTEWTVIYDTRREHCNGWQEFKIEPVIKKIRYIRLHALHNLSNSGFCVAALQAFQKYDIEKIKKSHYIEIKNENNFTIEIGDGLPVYKQLENLSNQISALSDTHTLVSEEKMKKIMDNVLIHAYDIKVIEIEKENIKRTVINPIENSLSQLGKADIYNYAGLAIGIISLVLILCANIF